jgi:hypothetical protein
MLDDKDREERTEDYVCVVAAPPLTTEQRNRLCALMCGDDG